VPPVERARVVHVLLELAALRAHLAEQAAEHDGVADDEGAAAEEARPAHGVEPRHPAPRRRPRQAEVHRVDLDAVPAQVQVGLGSDDPDVGHVTALLRPTLHPPFILSKFSALIR
jgi:hypothetical protein